MRRLHILTVNVNGLKKNGKKLLEELEKLKSENSEVDVFLTETHVKDRDDWENYKEDWKIFFTCFDSRSKGCYNSKLENRAAILLNKKRDFRCLPEIVDQSGCYVIVSCWISRRLCTFVSVYHHKKQRGLLKELSEKIKPPYTDILVVGGNFNTALDKVEDRRSLLNNSVHNRIRKELVPFMGEHNPVDAWRKKIPDEEQYTYMRNIPEISRSDYFFINTDKWELVKDCRINRDDISDHRFVISHSMMKLKEAQRTV
uniref:Endonuclease/exonuclease/phosphatase domain-containing protein n=1 Tax=Paramormyrops kingsleyae TaxID=1676925 RepID=A0A3B3RW72_9TELE